MTVSLYIFVDCSSFVPCSAMCFDTAIPSSGMCVKFTYCIACSVLRLIAIKIKIAIKILILIVISFNNVQAV